jgi:hypothetical protein
MPNLKFEYGQTWDAQRHPSRAAVLQLPTGA